MNRRRRTPSHVLGLTLVSGLLFAVPAAAQSAPSITLESHAQQLYQAGREHFAAGDFEAARAAFQASLATVDSPNSRMYLGRTLHRLGRLADAWATLDRAARDAAARAAAEPRYAPTGAAARAAADAIAPSLAWLTIVAPAAPDDLAVTVNGAPVQRGGLGVTMPLIPGEVVVEASAPNLRDARVTLSLTAGQHHDLALSLAPRPPEATTVPESPTPAAPRMSPSLLSVSPDRARWRVSGFVTLGLGAASAIAAVVLAASAVRAHDQLARDRDAGRDLDLDLKASGILQRDLASGCAIGALALWATGGVLLGLSRRGASTPTPVALHLTPGGLGGTF